MSSLRVRNWLKKHKWIYASKDPERWEHPGMHFPWPPRDAQRLQREALAGDECARYLLDMEPVDDDESEA